MDRKTVAKPDELWPTASATIAKFIKSVCRSEECTNKGVVKFDAYPEIFCVKCACEIMLKMDEKLKAFDGVGIEYCDIKVLI